MKFSIVLFSWLLSCCFWLGLMRPAGAANSLLQLTDLPAGFRNAAVAETESCRLAGEVVAFVLADATQQELICVSSFSVTIDTQNPEQAEAMRQLFDAILQNPQQLIAQANQVNDEQIEILDPLPQVGETATGFSKTESRIGRTEVVIFRSGDLFNSVLIRYPAEQAPTVPLATVAHTVDRRINPTTSR